MVSEHIGRLVVVDQKPIGRTPRSNMATYTGLFDHVEKTVRSDPRVPKLGAMMQGVFLSTLQRANVRPALGEGSVCVELLFPSQCLRSLPDVSRLPIQYQNPGNQVSW